MSQFGFGRRTCQGVDIVEQELFLVMGGLAWGFNITGKKDEFGRDMYVPADKYTSLLIAKPVEFQFELSPVSNERLQMVEKMWRDVNGGQVEDLTEEQREKLEGIDAIPVLLKDETALEDKTDVVNEKQSMASIEEMGIE
jgi:hypothetical protein